jgi:hypothetical protein
MRPRFLLEAEQEAAGTRHRHTDPASEKGLHGKSKTRVEPTPAPPWLDTPGRNGDGWRAYVRYSVGVGMQHLEWVAAERGATHVAVSADEPRPVPFDVVTLSGLRVRTVMAIIMGLVLAVTLAFPTIDVSVEPTAAASRRAS